MTAGQAERANAVAPAPAPPGRPPEMEDWLNAHVFHPLAHRLARALIPTGISANAVSVIGGLMVVAAAFFYARLDWPASVLLGFLAHSLWHVFDGADGEVARASGKASPMGEIVDGACDYAGHGILYLTLAAILDDQLGLWAWALGVAASGSRIVQSIHAESGRRTYLWRAYGIPWLKQAKAGEDELFRRPGLFTRISTAFARGYIALAGGMSPLAQRVDALMAEASAAPDRREGARALCRRLSRLPLRLQTLLGPNLRTVALAASMAAGSPFWFLLVECTLVNLLLFWSVRRQAICDWRLEAALPGI
jgi:phosphatidylglycerophosphate synthase